SALLLAAPLGAAAACLIDLEVRIDCGDGFVDVRAGEQCEPAEPASYADKCGEGLIPGPGACDPKTCQFHPERCTRCGNGVLDEGEECDPANMTPMLCAGGVITCRDDCTRDTSQCDRCGNGVLDPGEECDYLLTPGPNVVEIACTELPTPAGISRRYGSGVATECGTDCRWDRSGCSYCQNNRLEDDSIASLIFIDFQKELSPVPEVCDNNHVDYDELTAYCKDICGGSVRVECKFKCADDCQGFDIAAVPEDELECCTAPGEDCPYEGGDPDKLKIGRLDCCRRKHAEPGEALCENVNVDGKLTFVCR
ncbi:MAG TPA: hypothetical protein VIK91_02740, partial [Nannocystis sp.]